MGRSHLSLDVLSALADGELAPEERQAATEHLFGCTACAGSLESFRALDGELRVAPAIGCDAALPLLSAHLDGELTTHETAVVVGHLDACSDCRALAARLDVRAALVALPAGMPSARVDRAIFALTRPAPRPSLKPVLGRALVAVTAAVAIVMAGVERGAAPVAVNTPQANDRVLVAAAQQVVLNPRTNTLYLLDPAAAAVDARDASTNDLKAHIDVGGQPTALALNESANTVLVLDASLHRVTEIDSVNNVVLSKTDVAVSGTPTGISVDPSANKILVTAATPSGAPGSVAVINGDTKKVESVRDFTVAPESMVFSPSGDRAALVSKDATTLVDSSYKPIATLPGGVAAAFAQGDDRIAILSTLGADSVVTFSGGRTSPLPLKLNGAPRAIASLPDGGFIVLVNIDKDHSRVSHVAPDGHEIGNVEVAAGGRDLVYDASSKRFSVANGGHVVWSDVPQGAVAAASNAPQQSAVTSPQPSTAPSPSPSATASPSATPSQAPATSRPLNTAAATPGFAHIDLPDGRAPYAVSQNGERLWILDDKNGIELIDLTTGDISIVTNLPKSARIAQFVAGLEHLYAIGPRGDVYMVNTATGRVSTFEFHLPKGASSAAIGPGDRLWVGLAESSLLLGFDPDRITTDTFDLRGAHVSRLTTDSTGRVYYADDSRNAIGMINPANGSITEVAFAHRGVTTAFVVDGSSTLWLGTSAGEIWSVRGGGATQSVGLQRPVTSIVLDTVGRAWYLSPLPPGALGFVYAPADGAGVGQVVAGPAFSIAFSALGDTWIADPRGGFYVGRAR